MEKLIFGFKCPNCRKLLHGYVFNCPNCGTDCTKVIQKRQQEIMEKERMNKRKSDDCEENIELLFKYALSKNEIEKNINDGLLPINIDEIITQKNDTGTYTVSSNSKIVCCVLRSENNLERRLRYTNFHFTSFHLIVCFKRDFLDGNYDRKNNLYYNKPDDYIIIPLEKIEYISFNGHDDSFFRPVMYQEKDKNPIVGAVVGGLIGGEAGAIAGAVAGSGTKTVSTGGYSVYYYIYDLVIKFKDDSTLYTFKKYFKDNITKFNTKESFQEKINLIQEKINKLISRANSEIQLSEKIEIINEDILQKNKKKQGCYVATCVYGSYNCPEVWILRRFRDYYLDKKIFGKIFIKIYYFISPLAVKIFGRSKFFKKINKILLDNFIIKLKSLGYSDKCYDDKY